MQMSCRALAALAFLIPALSQAADEAAGCKYLPAGKLDLAFSDSAPRPTVDSSVNGVPARALIGTASHTTFLMRSMAERLGLKLRRVDRYALGVGGAAATYRTSIDALSLGASHAGATEMLVLDDGAASGGPDLVVGANLLLRTDLEVSLADKSLRFFGPVNREDCANTHLAYWDRNAKSIPFKGSPYQKWVFAVSLNGVELIAQIDTGAERSSVSRDAAKRAGIPFDTPGLRHGAKFRGLGGEALDTRLATFDSFAIGDETIGRADLAIVDDSPHGSNALDMRLGLDFLRSHRVLFAMSQKRLYFSYLGGDVFAPHAQQTKDKP